MSRELSLCRRSLDEDTCKHFRHNLWKEEICKRFPADWCPASTSGRRVQHLTRASPQTTVIFTAAATHSPHQGHWEDQGKGHQEAQGETQEAQTYQETQSMCFTLFFYLLEGLLMPWISSLPMYVSTLILKHCHTLLKHFFLCLSSFLQIESGELDDPRPAVLCKEQLLFFGNLDSEISSEDQWVSFPLLSQYTCISKCMKWMIIPFSVV